MMNKALAMLLLACALQNVANGTSYGSYGVILSDLIKQFSISHSVGSLGLSLLALVGGLTSPLVGKLVDRWSLKKTVMLGLVFGGGGYLLASIAHQFPVFLLGFAAIAGAGVVFCYLPANALASRWFPTRTGLAVAVVNLPLLVAVGPPTYGWLATEHGWRSVMVGLALLFLSLLAVAWLIQDHPSDKVQTQAATAAPLRFADLICDRRFCFAVISIGILFASGIALVSHVVTFAMEHGIEKTAAATLISINGLAAVVGGLVFGYLSDRLGAAFALSLNAALAGTVWFLLSISDTFLMMSACVTVLGFCGGGVVAPMSAFVAKTYGGAAFGFVCGTIAQLVLPFTFGGPLLVGILYDAMHSYRVPFVMLGACCLVACVLSLLAKPASGNAALVTAQE